MSIFTYTATDDLASGTTLDTVVTRDFRLLSSARQRVPVTKRQTALGGAVESLKLRTEVHYRCMTEMLTPGETADGHHREFLASVENGETFDFDKDGTVAVPDNVIECRIVKGGYSTGEVSKKFHQYRFVIRES